MSFDTEFDYTAGETYLDDRITNFNARIATLDAEITALQAITGYDDMTDPEEATKTRRKDLYVSYVADLQAARDEIDAIQALSVGNKTTLYNMYVAIGENKQFWMARMMFNYAGLVADGQPVLDDEALDAGQITLLGSLICQKYSITSQANEVMNAFPSA